MSTTTQRPDLSFLTQGKIYWNQQNEICLVGACESDNLLAEKVCLKIPQLIQIAEMLFDLTSNDPNGIVHQLVSNTLNDIAR